MSSFERPAPQHSPEVLKAIDGLLGQARKAKFPIVDVQAGTKRVLSIVPRSIAPDHEAIRKEIVRRATAFEQDAVLEGLVPALDLAWVMG